MLDISIVIPTKNEEISIACFIDWCNIGLSKAGLEGEIVLMDSSTDRTPEIAKSLGARVINVEEPGLGRAYSAAQGQVVGKVIFLGDADCTYDFRELGAFLSKLELGFDFVMGNRFLGSIEKGAMPFHHQYFGSPATSYIFKHALGLPIGDIHCGMRAMTRALFESLPFLESGWEYATEMIVSARNLDAKMTEVPIKFFKEPIGRVSHHRRSSWLSPFKAGWGTLRVTATYLIDRLFVVPGSIILGISTILNILIFSFPKTFLNYFHTGVLTQSILVFTTSIGAFGFTTGQLARFAYRRKLSSLEAISGSNLSKRMFSMLVVSTLLELGLSLLAVLQWIHGFGNRVAHIEYSYSLISGWLTFTSLYFCILGISVVSLIGHHAQKFRD
jgi:glycosyltransferase involved in cell wall biosynthesis